MTDEQNDEAFDAMMRVALAPGEAGNQGRKQAYGGNSASRWSGAPWLMAAGLLVCGSVWWSTNGSDAGLDPATGAGPNSERNEAASAQAPHPDQSPHPNQDPRPNQDPHPAKGQSLGKQQPNRQELERLADQLGNPKQREQAARQLAAAGPPATDLLAERLTKLPVKGKSGKLLEGTLLGAASFGRRSARFVAAIEPRLAQFDLEQTLAACEVLAEAALWTEVTDAIADAETGSDFLKLLGHIYQDPGLAPINRAMAMFARLRARRTAWELAQAGDLLAGLTYESNRRRNGSRVRLATIERLAGEAQLDGKALEGLEQVLASMHPQFLDLRWVKSGAQINPRSASPTLHAAAAELLLRRAPEHPASVRAHARRAANGTTHAERRASTLALGRLLADSPADGDARQSARIQIACDALRAAITATKSRMTAEQIALSGDAATAAGMIGAAAKSLQAELLYLAGSPNRGLAERARRAMQRISQE